MDFGHEPTEILGVVGQVVDHAVEAAGALKTLEPCADAALLRNVLPPPDDPAARAEVARIRTGIAEAKAMDDAGDSRGASESLKTLVADARRVGYAPVLGEALLKLSEIQVIAGERVQRGRLAGGGRAR